MYLGASLIAAAAPTPGGLGAIEAALVAGFTGVGMESGRRRRGGAELPAGDLLAPDPARAGSASTSSSAATSSSSDGRLGGPRRRARTPTRERARAGARDRRRRRRRGAGARRRRRGRTRPPSDDRTRRAATAEAATARARRPARTPRRRDLRRIRGRGPAREAGRWRGGQRVAPRHRRLHGLRQPERELAGDERRQRQAKVSAHDPGDRDDDERADEAPDLHGCPDRSPQKVREVVDCLEQAGLPPRHVIRHCNGRPAGREEQRAAHDRGHLAGPHCAWSLSRCRHVDRGHRTGSPFDSSWATKGPTAHGERARSPEDGCMKFSGSPSSSRKSRPGRDAGRVRPDAEPRGCHLHDRRARPRKQVGFDPRRGPHRHQQRGCLDDH